MEGESEQVQGHEHGREVVFPRGRNCVRDCSRCSSDF
jgi:hypothetical protein